MPSGMSEKLSSDNSFKQIFQKSIQNSVWQTVEIPIPEKKEQQQQEEDFTWWRTQYFLEKYMDDSHLEEENRTFTYLHDRYILKNKDGSRFHVIQVRDAEGILGINIETQNRIAEMNPVRFLSCARIYQEERRVETFRDETSQDPPPEKIMEKIFFLLFPTNKNTMSLHHHLASFPFAWNLEFVLCRWIQCLEIMQEIEEKGIRGIPFYHLQDFLYDTRTQKVKYIGFHATSQLEQKVCPYCMRFSAGQLLHTMIFYDYYNYHLENPTIQQLTRYIHQQDVYPSSYSSIDASRIESDSSLDMSLYMSLDFLRDEHDKGSLMPSMRTMFIPTYEEMESHSRQYQDLCSGLATQWTSKHALPLHQKRRLMKQKMDEIENVNKSLILNEIMIKIFQLLVLMESNQTFAKLIQDAQEWIRRFNQKI